MNLARFALIATLPLVVLPAPAAGCNLDGLPGFDGFHRMNPFADAYRRYQEEDRFQVPEQQQEKPADTSKAEPAAKAIPQQEQAKASQKPPESIR
jgi:hypothetical protein